MARRRRRKSITYTSKETRIVLGLLFLLATIILFISITDNTPGDNLFTIARNIFGQATVVATFTALNISLYFLDVQYVFTKGVSLFSQIGLSVLYPTLLSSILGNEKESLEAAASGLAGGQLGHFVSWEIFFDRPFAQYTPLIVGLACFILLLLTISVSLEQIGMAITKTLEFVGNMTQAIVTRVGGMGTEQSPKPEKPAAKPTGKATRFSDFTSNLTNDKPKKKEPKTESQDKEPEPKPAPTAAEVAATSGSKLDDLDVTISEREVPDDGLFNEDLAYPEWQLPPLSLLSPYKKIAAKEEFAGRNSQIIEQTLASFNIDANVADIYIGPSVVRYALDMPLGIKVAKVAGLSENIALALGVASNQIRIEPIPGTTYLGIEAPKSARDIVHVKEICESLQEQEKMTLGVTLGKDINGRAILADLKKMPHLLIAGATGSGKSVLTNAFITSLLTRKTPDELQLILVDPKQVELQDYNGIPHLLLPVITDMSKVVNALKWCVSEMEKRYKRFADARVRNIEGYNQKMGYAAVPYIVVVIDEMADMMMTGDRNETENAIVRLAQKARATGIHLVLATQRPSVNVITGIIKANIPGRVGMSVTSSTDSRVILDQVGAESLLGNGDLLYKAPDKTKSERLQAPLITQEEVGSIVDFIRKQAPEVEYVTSILESNDPGASGAEAIINEFSDDDLFKQAVRIVASYGKGSSSYLQRRLNIGFNRAARLLDEMEELGVVGPPVGSKPRDVLITDADAFFASLDAQQNPPSD